VPLSTILRCQVMDPSLLPTGRESILETRNVTTSSSALRMRGSISSLPILTLKGFLLATRTLLLTTLNFPTIKQSIAKCLVTVESRSQPKFLLITSFFESSLSQMTVSTGPALKHSISLPTARLRKILVLKEFHRLQEGWRVIYPHFR